MELESANKKIKKAMIRAEDNFTSALHCLILEIPEIGQKMIDAIWSGRHQLSSKFKYSKDHPQVDSANRPDFLLSCEGFDVLCEHKLESDLGCRQLERYLDFSKDRPTYLVLITNRMHTISDEVVNHSNYLRPKSSSVPYFSWEFLYVIISERTESRAQEFILYMRELSMEPSPLPENWADLFLNRQTAKAFIDTTEELRGFIKQIDANYRIAPNKLGIEVKKVRPGIHLLYFSAIRRSPFAERSISAPYLSARIFIKKDNLEYINRFRNPADLISDECVKIFSRTVDEVSTWDKNLIFSYEYVASLENFVTDDIGRMKRNILGFGRRIYEHVVDVGE